MVDVEISSASHPFWTGRQRLMDSAGRVEKFRAKYARRKPPERGDAAAG